MEHIALRNLYEQVVNGSFKWQRWGLLSVLCDYVLYYNQGDILEIGICETSIHLSKLAEKYHRNCYHVDYSKSLIENMSNTKGYFGDNSKVFNMKSIDFFNSLSNADIGYPKLALAFIDGDHEYEVVKEDFYNTLKYLVQDGYIFLHDSYPPTKEWTIESKCGTVYLFRKELENNDNFDVFTFPKSAFDVGLTMVRKRDIRKWEEK